MPAKPNQNRPIREPVREDVFFCGLVYGFAGSDCLGGSDCSKWVFAKIDIQSPILPLYWTFWVVGLPSPEKGTNSKVLF